MSNTRRIGFRGDSRDPKEIFEKGFDSKDPNEPIIFKGDSDQDKAVSVSWRMSAASYFPLDFSKNNQTWLYVINVDLSSAPKDEIFISKMESLANKSSQAPVLKTESNFSNIHGRQVMEAITGDERPGAEDSIYSMLFAQEVALKKIKPQDVIFAVECRREWNNNNDCDYGGKYFLGQIKENPNHTASPEMVRRVRVFLENEVKLSKAGQGLDMASVKLGYNENKETFRSQQKTEKEVHSLASKETPKHLTLAELNEIPSLFLDKEEAISCLKNSIENYKDKKDAFVDLIIERAANSGVKIEKNELLSELESSNEHLRSYKN